MKKEAILVIILILIAPLTIGCNRASQNTYFIKAQNKLENNDYDEALNLLSQVLDENPENESARAMYMQAMKMKSAQIYEKNNDYEKAIKELEYIVNIDNGSKKIKRQSINKKAELEKLQEKYDMEVLQRKENAKKAAKEYINNTESKIIYENNKKQEDKKEDSVLNQSISDTDENDKWDDDLQEID